VPRRDPAAPVVFWPFPTFPHVGPTLGVAQELVRRGRRVVYAAPESFRATVAEAGADLIPYRPDPRPLVPGSTDPVDFAFGYYLAVLGEASRLERELAGCRPSALVYDTHLWATGAGLARRLGARGIQTFATFASNGHFSLRREEAAMNGDGGHPSVDVFHGAVAALARERGFGSFTRDDFLAGHAETNLVFMPREFQIAGDTFDDRHTFVGPCPGSGGLAGDWTPPAAGPRIVLASLGTSPLGRDPGFFRSCVRAFAGSGFHLVLTVGEVDPDELGPLPEWVEVHRWLRHPAVLRHADVFVSQAGVGSMMEAMAHGVPLVMSPRNGEHKVNAARAEELGLGRVLPEAATPDDLLAAVAAVADDPAVRARTEWLRAAVVRSGGAARAADVIG
jgi:MGT family glycosyltransferase